MPPRVCTEDSIRMEFFLAFIISLCCYNEGILYSCYLVAVICGNCVDNFLLKLEVEV